MIGFPLAMMQGGQSMTSKRKRMSVLGALFRQKEETMWLVHLFDKRDEAVIIVFVRQAVNEQEAADKAANEYRFSRGYEAVARKIDETKDVQEIFNSWRD
jgi:hypothetical protein